MKEEWKDIKSYRGFYQVSNLGKIKNLKRKEVLLKPYISKQGYLNVKLIDPYFKKGNNYLVHRLVAEAFIPNPENKPQVNHKDGNKLNNSVDNLEWVTSSENNQHAYNTGLNKYKQKYFGKPVAQYTKKFDFIKVYPSITTASNETKINLSQISLCCQKRKHRNTAGGYIWRYYNE